MWRRSFAKNAAGRVGHIIRRMYGGGAHAPKGYRRWLAAKIKPLIRAYGLEHGVEDPMTCGPAQEWAPTWPPAVLTVLTVAGALYLAALGVLILARPAAATDSEIQATGSP